MILPSDSDYKETKLILQGKATIKPEFQPLAAWIDKTFDVKTINIVFDWIEIKSRRRPRLGICFEFEREKVKFDLSEFHIDPAKQQAIADQFKQTLQEQGRADEPSLFDQLVRQNRKAQYSAEDVWVIFSAFEPVAKAEANSSITKGELLGLKKSLDNPDLWEISKMFALVTFFLYTDRQVKEYENSLTRVEWANRYLDLLTKYDKFGYFQRDTFSIKLDSKENFDQNYQSNWYYYYK